jgi:hypothetical protein
MMMDEIRELADRMRGKMRRGEEPGLEFETDFHSFTRAEQHEYIALEQARIAHGEERLEAIEAQNRALKALLVLQVRRAPGMSVQEAIGSGRIGLLEVVEAVQGAVPDPLAQPPD